MRKGSVSIGTTLGRLTVIDKTDGAAGTVNLAGCLIETPKKSF